MKQTGAQFRFYFIMYSQDFLKATMQYTFIKFQISSSCEFLLFAILSAQNSWYCPFVMAVSNWLDRDTNSVSVTTLLTWTWWGTGCCGCSGLIDSNVISFPPNYSGKHKYVEAVLLILGIPLWSWWNLGCSRPSQKKKLHYAWIKKLLLKDVTS